MSFARCTLSAALVLNLLAAAPVLAQDQASTPPDTAPASHDTLPQIVRLSFAEGDVRLALGKRDAKLTGTVWEQAAANVPLASGYSVATGAGGRAEIEFEDASTIYIAPNSAVTFADLTTKDNVPYTRMALLSGTVALHLQPTVPGEHFLLQTPTNTIGVSYGEKNYSRVTSYLDGIHMTPFEGTQLTYNGTPHALPHGATYIFYGQTMYPRNIAPTPELAAFDLWVADRVRTRGSAMQSVMQQAGLNTPLAGLADLAGQGTFTSCAPYGTCWQPTHGWGQQSDPSADAEAPIRPLPEAQASYDDSQTAASAAAVVPAGFVDDLDNFPCDPYRLWYLRSQMLF